MKMSLVRMINNLQRSRRNNKLNPKRLKKESLRSLLSKNLAFNLKLNKNSLIIAKMKMMKSNLKMNK